MINFLLEKGIIEEAGFKQTTQNFARMYRPAITKEKWFVYQMLEGVKDRQALLKFVLSEILKEIREIKK